MHRTPPSNNSLSGSRSESDLPTVSANNMESDTNVTTRNKRLRIESSPEQSSMQSSSHTGDLRTDLLNMLTNWKEDQERRWNEWKISLDCTLSKLVTEVTDLKKECQEIKKANAEIEKGMEFINEKQEETATKVKEMEKEKKANADAIKNIETQIQDIHFQTRNATIEIRNIPYSDSEKFDDLLSVLSCICKAMDLTINSTDIRDIYRLPGKPGVSRPIVAEFSCVQTRNEFISRVRRFNKEKPTIDKLNTQNIGLPGVKQPIYIDEHLPPSQRKLMFITRQFAKKHNYSCWHSNGKILLRMDTTGKPIIIQSEKSLSDLVKRI